MSNGIDNLSTGAMTGNGPEVVYQGQNFAGMGSQATAAINIDGMPQVVVTDAGSASTLGTNHTLDIQSSQRK